MGQSARSDTLYKIGRLCAWAFLPALLILYCSIPDAVVNTRWDGGGGCGGGAVCGGEPKQTTEQGPPTAIVISFCAVLITGLGTASTVILGWRNDRRQAAESKLKIEQLELQLAELRRSDAKSSK
jgi:hypothetical protein